MSCRSVVLGAAVLGLAAACAGNPAPSGWLPSPSDAPTDPYGAWIDVRLPLGDDVSGEFIAVSRDTVFVLTDAGQLVPLPVPNISNARIASYTSQWGSLAAWTALGSIATLSHGMVATITLPLWLIVGPIATASQSRAPFVNVRDEGDWDAAQGFARFPQGMPEGLDRRILNPRKLAGDGRKP